MNDSYDAFELSPVPAPGPDAVPPEPFHGIYGMPMFVTIPTADLAGSVDFWTRGMGFFELFAIPGRLVHLRRWAFQDVLLVPTDKLMVPTDKAPDAVPTVTVSFACVLNQLDPLVTTLRALGSGSVGEPLDTAWNTRDVEVITPENVRVVLTAARPLVRGSRQEEDLRSVGIAAPDNGTHAPPPRS